MNTKVCTQCNEEKEATKEYFNAAKFGALGLTAKCIICRKVNYNADRTRILEKNKKLYEENKDQILAQQKEYYHKNKEDIRLRNNERYANDPKMRELAKQRNLIYQARYPEKIAESRKRYASTEEYKTKRRERSARERVLKRDEIVVYMREYRDRNRDKVTNYYREYREANRDSIRISKRNYVKTNVWAHLRHRVGTLLRRSLSNYTISNTKQELLGYSYKELAVHLERQFNNGMSWDEFMKGNIHIDHIIPVSHFKPTSTDDPNFKHCWALCNLRPLWAKDNLTKAARVASLL